MKSEGLRGLSLEGLWSHLPRRMTTHVLERREQLRPLLRAAADAEALKRSLEEVSRLRDELTRGAPVLERLLADGVAGRRRSTCRTGETC